jgi:integral membrane protein
MKKSAWSNFEAHKPFTEKQAWDLFRLAAFGEVLGWTLLISGIIIEKLNLPGSHIAVPIAGSIHGLLFMFYVGICIATYSSLGWSRRKFLIALIASTPPFGTLLYEIWAAQVREKTLRQSYRRIIVRGVIIAHDALLVLQTSGDLSWTVPGGYISHGETPEKALVRILYDLTTVTASVGPFLALSYTTEHSEPCLVLYYTISNPSDFSDLNLKKIREKHATIDEIKFAKPDEIPNLKIGLPMR